MYTHHTPVMVHDVVRALAPKDSDVVVDGTFGAGGYSRALLKASKCKVFAIDRDPTAEQFAEALKQEFGDRITFIVGNFADMCDLLKMYGIEAVDAVVLDIGVSSMQLDDASRGFSFRHDAPLDMRMSRQGWSAADVIAHASEEELANIIFQYGEEKASRRIAKAIVKARMEAPITRTVQLAEIVRGVVQKSGKIDPATRTFQALRIHVNDELGALKQALNSAERILRPGGRLVVVTFHSLEDRMVKQFMQNRGGREGIGSRHLPIQQSVLPSFSLPRPNKLLPSSEEMQANARARSATLRIAVRNENPARHGELA